MIGWLRRLLGRSPSVGDCMRAARRASCEPLKAPSGLGARSETVVSASANTCSLCGTDHDGYPDGSLGAELRCIRVQAAAAGDVVLVGQVDEFQVWLAARRDEAIAAYFAGEAWLDREFGPENGDRE